MAHELTPMPPPLAERVLAACAFDAVERDVLLGDMAEGFDAVATASGPAAARRWYRLQCLHSMGPLLGDALRRGGLRGAGRIALAVLAGYVVLALCVIAFGALTGGLLWWNVTALSVAMLAASIGAAVIGGWLAARVAPRAPLLAAAALGVACIVIGMLLALSPEVSQGDRDPLWYRVLLQIVVLPSTLLGGVLAVRRRAS